MATDKESAAKVDLGLLEEDDEFEEFPADGVCHNRKIPLQICSYFFLGNIVSNTCKYSHERGALFLDHKIMHANQIHFGDTVFSQMPSRRAWRIRQ